MYIANELKKVENVRDIDSIKESFIEHLNTCVNKFFADKSMFEIENFSYYYFDEFELQTNCNKDIFSTVYLEIDQPLNYKPSAKKKTVPKTKKTNADKADKFEIPNLYLNLTQIKDGLASTFLNHFDSNTIVWQSKYGVGLKSQVLFDDGETHSYYFNVIPCFTHYNKNNCRGIFYYYNNEVQIEYPLLALENFETKNDETKDLFRQTVLIFKNILLREKDIDRIPFEIIETILYNVPNSLFVSDSQSDILKIVNFIRNNPLKEFKTMDEQDYAFSSIYRSMSVFYVKHILKIIENFLSKIK